MAYEFSDAPEDWIRDNLEGTKGMCQRVSLLIVSYQMLTFPMRSPLIEAWQFWKHLHCSLCLPFLVRGQGGIPEENHGNLQESAPECTLSLDLIDKIEYIYIISIIFLHSDRTWPNVSAKLFCKMIRLSIFFLFLWDWNQWFSQIYKLLEIKIVSVYDYFKWTRIMMNSIRRLYRRFRPSKSEK